MIPTFLQAYKRLKCYSVTDSTSMLLCKNTDVQRHQYSSEGMCGLWTILDNNLKCIPPSTCKITHPQKTRLAFLFHVACNQMYGYTSTSVSELLNKYFELKQPFGAVKHGFVKRGTGPTWVFECEPEW